MAELPKLSSRKFPVNRRNKMEKRLTVNQLLALAAANWPRARARMTEVAIQIIRAAECVMAAHASAIAPFGLQSKEFAVLTALRIAGPPYELTPTAIYRSELLSSGGLTKILYRLERSGLISRHLGAEDGRSRLVRLTPRGRTAIEKAMSSSLRMEANFLIGLREPERAALAALLEKLLRPNELGTQNRAAAPLRPGRVTRVSVRRAERKPA